MKSLVLMILMTIDHDFDDSDDYEDHNVDDSKFDDGDHNHDDVDESDDCDHGDNDIDDNNY